MIILLKIAKPLLPSSATLNSVKKGNNIYIQHFRHVELHLVELMYRLVY